MADPRTEASTAGLSGTFDSRGWQGEGRSVTTVPALTVLFHPDVRRVGEWTALSELLLGREAQISRNYPDFISPDRLPGGPLADRYISRRPVLLQPAPGRGVVLSLGESRTRVDADGVPVLQSRELSAAELECGVVVELAGRVVLLLHWLSQSPLTDAAGRLGLVGESERLARVRADVRRVADLDVPVMLRGETGTGKELVARAIHDSGPRRSGPFIAINLGAIQTSLVASELFGAVKGAFTGSVQSQEGYFRRAHGGTLLLDEVGEAPPEVQVMLLRVLETKEISPVGSQAPQRVDVRVLAATDTDLEARVQSGEFRAPLLHRLSGYEIWLPPLRDRREDLGRLLVHFLRQELASTGEVQDLTAETWLPAHLVARLARFSWPGNVRQLRNLVRQIVIGSRGLQRLEAGPVVERLLRTPDSPADAGFQPTPTPSPTPAEPLLVDRRKPADISAEELLAALRAHRWDLQATAAHLHISRPSLYALIESSPGVRKAGDLSAEEISRCWEECSGDLDAMVDRLEVSRKALARRLREMKLV
ncbi:MAG TPA: sigma 54-interacting transcriptional regulator [Thermoanaerobaculia bacterium]|jgi:two-component system nitrogen regulation response regulator GlnG|nr:sigma 54-interacting transcriptional regulator [Thermoanaerobaculia bacterium]